MPSLWPQKKDVLRISKEAVIQTVKARLVKTLADTLDAEDDKQQFLTLCRRIDASVRSWYSHQFEELTYLYSFFDPLIGPVKLRQQNLSPEHVDKLELTFVKHVLEMFDKSNFKLVSQAEYDLAQEGEYLLNLPIEVDLSRLDTRLWSTYFATEGREDLPTYATHYLLFRGGIGIDQTSGYFYPEKIQLLLRILLRWLFWPLIFVCNQLWRTATSVTEGGYDALHGAPDDKESATCGHDEMLVERVRLENLKISLRNLFTRTTIQKPTFERIILLYRKATPPDCPDALRDRAIYIKHFHNIPMADLELVLPEKKNPGLTPMDTVKMLTSAAAGAVAMWHTLAADKINFAVIVAIVTAVVGYFSKVYTDYHTARTKYQTLLANSMYDKSMDTGKGTLLHICDDVIQQEVKEVIIAYFVLMTRGALSEPDLDERCEKLLEETFEEQTNFEVSDAIAKLEHLKLVTKDSDGCFSQISLTEANQILGPTYDELLETRSEVADVT